MWRLSVEDQLKLPPCRDRTLIVRPAACSDLRDWRIAGRDRRSSGSVSRASVGVLSHDDGPQSGK